LSSGSNIATFATMQRLDAAHCSTEAHLTVSKIYH
jgi:hypothetical protein